MKKIAIVGSFVCMASCSNDVTFAPTDNPFVGDWSCVEIQSLAFPDSTYTGVPTTRRYLVASPQQGQVVVAVEGDAGSCALQFSTKSGDATLLPGQSCQSPSGMRRAFTMGTASVANQMLVMDVAFDVSEDATDGSPGRNGTGSMTDHCSRLGG